MPTTPRSNEIDIPQNSSIDTDLQSIIDAIADLATQATINAISNKLPALIGGRIPIDIDTLPIASDAATETTLQTLLTLAAFQARINTLGQKNMAGSTPVVLPSDQSPIPTRDEDIYLAGASGQTAAINNILSAVAGTDGSDCLEHRSATVHFLPTGTITGGTYIVEGSNDSPTTGFVPIPIFNQALATGAPIVTAITANTTPIIYYFNIPCRWIRVRIVTPITGGGSIRVSTRFSRTPFAPASQQVGNSVGSNLNVVSGIAAGQTLTTVATVNTVSAVTNAGVSTQVLTLFRNTNVLATPLAVKGSSGRIYRIYILNQNATECYIKFYNALTGAVTIGTTKPQHTIKIPPANGTNLGEYDVPAAIISDLQFTAAITIAATTGITDNNNTPPPTGLHVEMSYI